jgi:hypothetical protein
MTIAALLASQLLGLHLVNLVNAIEYPIETYTPPSYSPYLHYVTIQPGNGTFYINSVIPLTVCIDFHYGKDTPNHEITVQDLQNVICQYSLDNADWHNIPFIEITSRSLQSLLFGIYHVNCTYNTTLQGLSEGSHLINITINPIFDSPRDYQVYFTVYDTLSVTIHSPQNKTYNANSLSLNFTVNQPTSWMGYGLDGQDNVTVTGNTTLSGLTSGAHSITVYAKDELENTCASETINFTTEEPFPTTLLAAIAVIAVFSGIGLVVYFKKLKRTRQPLDIQS